MAARYSVEDHPGVSVLGMWSQPYDLNLHSLYHGAGVTMDHKEGDSMLVERGLFTSMYYDQGDWSRAMEDQMAR